MSVIALTSCSGSPGVTSLGLALTAYWPRPAVLVEADPDGGHLAARCGIPVRPGLVDLAAVSRSGRVSVLDVGRVAQRSPEGVQLVVAHPAPDQVRVLLGSSAGSLAEALRTLDGIDVLVDIGRLRPSSESWPLVMSAHEVLIVSGTRVEDVAAMVHRRALIDDMSVVANVGLLVTASGEHSADDAARAVQLPLIAVRPGRSGRRTSDRSRHRHAEWIRRLALDLAAQMADRTDVDRRATAVSVVQGDLSHGSLPNGRHTFARPCGPPLPGPSFSIAATSAVEDAAP